MIVNVGGFIGVFWQFCNDAYPVGSPIQVIWNLPGLGGHPGPLQQNCVNGANPQQAENAVGGHTGSAIVTWPNGQVRTFTCFYQIIP